MRGSWPGGRATVGVLVVGLAAVAAGVWLGLRPVSHDGVPCGTPFWGWDETDSSGTYEPVLGEVDCGDVLVRSFLWAVLLIGLGVVATIGAAFTMLVGRPEVPALRERNRARRRRWLWITLTVTVLLFAAAGWTATRAVTADGVDCGSVLRGVPDEPRLTDGQAEACDDARAGTTTATVVLFALGTGSFLVGSWFEWVNRSPGYAEASFHLGGP